MERRDFLKFSGLGIGVYTVVSIVGCIDDKKSLVIAKSEAKKIPNIELEASPLYEISPVSYSTGLTPSSTIKEDISFSKFANKEKVSLIPQMEYTANQGSRGTCTAFAATKAIEFLYKKKLSEQHLYYLAFKSKPQSGQTEEGLSVQGVLDVLKNQGICEEKYWPYNPEKIDENLPQAPPPDDATAAVKYKISSYKSIKFSASTLSEIISSLIESQQLPLLATVPVQPEAGWINGPIIIQHPGVKLEPASHAIVLTGYDSKNKLIEFQNSWGSGWGLAGFGIMTFEYLANNVNEIWTISK